MKILKNYVDDKWLVLENNRFLDIENPSADQSIARVPLSTDAEVDHAVTAARAAYCDWSQTPVTKRVEYLYLLLHLLRQNKEKSSSNHILIAQLDVCMGIRSTT